MRDGKVGSRQTIMNMKHRNIYNMNRVLGAITLLLTVTACYDDYVMDYDVQGVGFANQTDVRSFIVGEGMTFSTGVALGGIIENRTDRVISYEIDHSLVNDQTLAEMKTHKFSYIQSLCSSISSLEALPASEYSLHPEGGVAGKVTIRSGSHLGMISVTVDSVAFLSDVSRTTPKFVIPIRLTYGDGSSLIEGKTTTVIGVRYENMLFGNYWHGGYTIVTDEQGNEIDRIYYPTTVPQADTKVWTLTTVEPFSLTANAVGSELNGSAPQMKLTLGADDKITISSVDGAKYKVEPDGESYFKRTRLLQERQIVLNYKYEKDGNTYHAKDTLSFRNRIRDGVNEWQDENPENYE